MSRVVLIAFAGVLGSGMVMHLPFRRRTSETIDAFPLRACMLLRAQFLDARHVLRILKF